MPTYSSTIEAVSGKAPFDQGVSSDPEQKEKMWHEVATENQKKRVSFVYDEREEMIKQQKKTYVQFNDRTPKQFWDDGEKRTNAYVLSKESQGKEPWQANFATRAYANKTKALLATVARDIPEMRIKAVRSDDSYDHFAADITKNLVNHSYNTGNVQEELFFLAWSNAGHGTVLSYEGLDKQIFEKRVIVSFDLVTGDIEDKVISRSSEGEPVSYEIQLNDLLIKNFFIRDIQDQPSLIIQKYYADHERFLADFGKYPNSKYVRDLADITKVGETDTYFHAKWQESCVDGKGYYVCLYMNKWRNGNLGLYRIVANGVELFNGPMPWRMASRNQFGRPAYPIAKTVFEPFANTDFFYGNSLPNSAMGEGDVINTLYNSSLDKQYRSMVPPLLIGSINKDMLDLEDEVVAGDTKIYVDDIAQVKQMEIRGISDSDVKMIDLISRGLDLTTLDPQAQGQAQKYITARAALSADENARQLKGIFTMFMTSLWLQKVRLRLPNIVLAYSRPKLVEVIGEDNTTKLIKQYRQFNVENTMLSDGSKGTLGIKFMDKEEMTDKVGMKSEINDEEKESNDAGKPFEKVVMPFGWLDHFGFDVEIIPETLWQSSQALAMAMVVEKMTVTKNIFPEYFAGNKELFFNDFIKNYGDDPARYELPPTMNFQQEQGLELAKGMAGKGRGGASGGGPGQVTKDITGSEDAQRLAGVVGQ